MIRPAKTAKDMYTEMEAAAELKISLDRLHLLLDHKVFNDGSTRPRGLSFQATDIIVMRYWLDQDSPRLIQIPPRLPVRQSTGTEDFDR